MVEHAEHPCFQRFGVDSQALVFGSNLSGDMAVRFEKALGVDMDTLMQMQNSYDITRTRSRANKIHVERYEPRPAA